MFKVPLSRRSFAAGTAGLLASAAMPYPANALDGPLHDIVEGGEDLWLALDAYAFAYPLVTMEMTRRVITNVPKVEETHGPMGQLIKVREYPTASFRDVTAPNADTLYTTSFIDVGDEPWVVSVPDLDGRYALFPMLDGWTTVFAVPGKRTTGTGAQTWAITGPGWSGTLPDGMTEYKSPTSIVWLLGRIYCTGTPEDYAAVHKIQDEIKLMPLSKWGGDWTPPPGKVDPEIDMKTPVRDQVNGLDTTSFFSLFCDLMKRNPPAAADAPMLEKLAKIGIVPGQDFDASKLDAAFAKRIPQLGFAKIMLHFKASGGDIKNINGWGFTLKTGLYGTDYTQRALIAAIGLGANRPQDAVYPTSTGPGGIILNRTYQGTEKYTVTFKKGLLPPVRGFWSLTMYDKNYFFVANPLNRYSISERQDLKPNPDGSVTLYLQHASPGADKESNWLPAPPDRFILMLRLYWPDENNPSILDGSWVIPPVVKVS
ncbi:DUF1254 domain-containing protein [Stappia sp. F7233]|uniref:DUF1254 domain-containing protein n=1 Tax=Stappia albiluteola TaxID=2758565 RepID=A0A839AB76_9HYPH|nr:DUF1254 domain-containing protein [Stappia albiluteola]MBA5776157.1 DUF1254 domain-containing protein [Stappia albiluteola]